MARTWNINRRLLDAAIKRRRMLMLVENGVVRSMATVFRDAEAEISGKIVNYLGSRDPDTWLTAARRARILGAMQETLNDLYPTLQRDVHKALKEQALAESDLVLGRLRDATAQLPEDIPVYRPSASQLEQLVTHQLPRDMTGRMQALDETISGLKPAAQKRLTRAFQDAVVRGDGSAKIASAVRSAIGVSTNDATRLARTMILRVSNDSARLSYHRNKHLVREGQWMATLDKRTCLQCASQDGRTFEIEQAPVLPAHYMCRCFLSPVIASWRQMGIPADKANDDIRRLFDGKPAERVTYRDWLADQPAALQRDVLGATRYEAYRDGAAKLDDFATDRRVLTVAEYKERAA